MESIAWLLPSDLDSLMKDNDGEINHRFKARCEMFPLQFPRQLTLPPRVRTTGPTGPVKARQGFFWFRLFLEPDSLLLPAGASWPDTRIPADRLIQAPAQPSTSGPARVQPARSPSSETC